MGGPIPIRDLDPDEAGKVSFSRDIRPILDHKCLGCHSGKKPKGMFDVTSVENLLKEGGSAGPGVIPGKPDQSAVVLYVSGLLEPQMPKDEPPLSEEEVDLIRLWILGGARDDTGLEAEEAADANSVPDRHISEGPSPEEIQEILFVADPAEQLIRKRNLRLAYLPPAPTPPEVKAPVYNPIDRFIAARWESQEDPELSRFVPEVCDDATFVRRVFLDLVGRIPSVEEAQAFLGDSEPQKRERLVDSLLARNEEYAAHWTPFWEDALCSNGNHQGGVGTHGNYRDWAYDSFLRNKPYDVMVAELIDTGMPNHPPKYILNSDTKKTTQSAANAAQVFLGTSMKCASCHNHFENKEWTQTRFYAFAGYFSEGNLELIRCEEPTGQFIETAFMFDIPGAPKDVPSDMNGRLRRVAQLLVDPTNPRFAKAIVNRLWKRHMGLGLFEPADDFRLDRPPSHPELLEWLADDFMRHGYDLKHTIRMILTSRTYQLRHDPRYEDQYDIAKPDLPRYFRSPSLRRLTAEQILDSLMLVVGMSEWRGKAKTYQDDESTPLTRALGRPSTRNEVSTARPDDVAVVQALELLNGTEFHERIYTGPALAEMVKTGDAERIVTDLHLRALSRPPSPEALRAGVEFFEAGLAFSEPPGASDEEESPDPKVAAVGDMLWAFVSSPMFQYID
ncbi:MAG: hypothetical protein GHCLOJNM_04246 [bacterium]|nr:hypothetical protein [bacterium]